MNAIKLLKNRFVLNSPYRILHLITSKCNCRCGICNLWKNSLGHKNDLTTDQIIKMLDDARNAGIIFYDALGGEPLLRDDIGIILKYAKKIGLKTTVVTNGYYLKEKHNEIMPFIDVLAVSIDSNDNLHDEMRDCRGLREEAIEGIKLSKNNRTKILINSIISNKNLTKAYGLLELAQDLGVSICFQPIDLIKGYNENLIPTKNELKEVFNKIIIFKKSGYPITNSYEYLKFFTNGKKYVCCASKCFINIEPNGDIISCMHVHDKKWGNVKIVKLKDLFKSKEYNEFFIKEKNCNICNTACVIESSLFYRFNPTFLMQKIFSK